MLNLKPSKHASLTRLGDHLTTQDVFSRLAALCTLHYRSMWEQARVNTTSCHLIFPHKFLTANHHVQDVNVSFACRVNIALIDCERTSYGAKSMQRDSRGKNSRPAEITLIFSMRTCFRDVMQIDAVPLDSFLSASRQARQWLSSFSLSLLLSHSPLWFL